MESNGYGTCERTVGVRVVMDHRSLPWIPHQNQQVRITVSFVDQISSIIPRWIAESILAPFPFVRFVRRHELYEVGDFYVVAVNARVGTESIPDGCNELLEGVNGDARHGGCLRSYLKDGGFSGRIGCAKNCRFNLDGLLISSIIRTGRWT